jgi:hypothetical protein
MNYEQAIKELQDTVIVMAHLEARQSAMLKEHTRILSDHDSHVAEITEFRRRTEQNLAEITDKLSGLIGYVDGMRPPSRPS